MKLALIVAIVTALGPVQSYTQTDSFDEQVLVRRVSPESPADRHSSPSRSLQRSPGRTPLDSGTVSDYHSIVNMSHDPPSSAEHPRSPIRSSTRLPSPDSDSDSSTDRSRGMPRARIRAKVTGPAVVRYDADQHHPKAGPLAPGEKLRYTVRGHQRAAVDVTTHDGNPPGKAEMIVRGRRLAGVTVDSTGGGSGSITALAPLRQSPEVVEAGARRTQFIETYSPGPERQKLKAKMEGAGRIRGIALNPNDSAAG